MPNFSFPFKRRVKRLSELMHLSGIASRSVSVLLRDLASSVSFPALGKLKQENYQEFETTEYEITWSFLSKSLSQKKKIVSKYENKQTPVFSSSLASIKSSIQEERERCSWRILFQVQQEGPAGKMLATKLEGLSPIWNPQFVLEYL